LQVLSNLIAPVDKVQQEWVEGLWQTYNLGSVPGDWARNVRSFAGGEKRALRTFGILYAVKCREGVTEAKVVVLYVLFCFLACSFGIDLLTTLKAMRAVSAERHAFASVTPGNKSLVNRADCTIISYTCDVTSDPALSGRGAVSSRCNLSSMEAAAASS
jgi:hypothetical protein